MFWFCTKVQMFINEVASYLRHYDITVQINKKTWFFLTNLNAMEALLITLAKLVIHEARLNEKLPNITHFRNKLKYEAEIEKTAARLGNRQEIFEKKWGSLRRVLSRF